MKKYLAIVLGVLLVLSFAVVASAEDKPEVTLGGKMLLRGWYFNNVSAVTGAATPTETASTAMYSTNVFLTVDAKVADNVRGFIELETTTESGGTATRTSGLYYWGSQDQKSPALMLFRQAWVQYTGSGLLGVPAGIKAGHMLLTLGEKQFLNHERFGDDAILLTVEPSKELLIGLITAKLAENYSAAVSNADTDAHVLLATYKINKDTTVGLNYTYVNNSDTDLSLQNLGLHANGNISGVTYAAEVDYQFGNQNTTIDFGGYGILAKLGYKVDPVNIRASFAMGSGDDTATDNKNKEFQALVCAQGDYGATARFPHYTQLYERAIRTAAASYVAGNSNGQQVTTNNKSTGIANTTYYNLGLDVNPVKDLSLSLDGYILRATEAVSGVSSKDIGSEVDLTASYKLAKNLSYFVQAGIFSPGDYYGTSKKTATMAVHGLSLTF